MHDEITCGCAACAVNPTISAGSFGHPVEARQRASSKPRKPRRPGY